MNDSPTRSRLKSSLAATVLEIDSKPTQLADAKTLVMKSIEAVLLTRTGASAKVDWTVWRKGNQTELDRLGIVDVKDYSQAVKAMAAGL